MELSPIGRVEDPESLDLDPIVVPIVGYGADKKEIVEKFKFRPVSPAGAALDVVRSTDGEGNVPLGPVMRYLDKCLLNSEENERFHEFLNRDDVFIEQTTLVDLYQAISEEYAARPTRRSSGSAGGGSTTRQTSQAGQRAKASRSRPKR